MTSSEHPTSATTHLDADENTHSQGHPAAGPAHPYRHQLATATGCIDPAVGYVYASRFPAAVEMETEKQRNEWITQVTRREFTPYTAQNEREFEEWVDKIAEEVSQRTFRMHEPSLINIVIGQLPVALKQLVAEFSLEDRQEVECCHILALHAITCAQYVNWILAMTALAVHWIGHA